MAEPTTWICPACGGHLAADVAPAVCPVCADERQWVPPDGQRWTTMGRLAADGYRTEAREIEPGLLGIGSVPDVGVGQRALLVQTAGGNVLWDPPAFIDEAAIRAVGDAGGLRAVSSSHPHMYGAIVDWGEAFDAEILLAADDDGWLRRPARRVRTWSESLEVVPGVTLVQCGGHFPGSAVLHWADGADGAGVLGTGDTIFITPGADRVTFVYSAPNRLPLHEAAVARIVEAVAPYAFDRLYFGWWEPALRHGAKAVFERSARRYVELLRGDI